MSNTRRAFNMQINDAYRKFKDEMAGDLHYKHPFTCEFYHDMNLHSIEGELPTWWRGWMEVQRELRIKMNNKRKLP